MSAEDPVFKKGRRNTQALPDLNPLANKIQGAPLPVIKTALQHGRVGMRNRPAGRKGKNWGMGNVICTNPCMSRLSPKPVVTERKEAVGRGNWTKRS